MPTATLTWNPNTEQDLAGYKVYRGLGASTPSLLAALGKVTTYVDATVPNVSQDVSYNLTAVDLAGNESPHSLTVTKTVDVTPPQAPAGLSVVLAQ